MSTDGNSDSCRQETVNGHDVPYRLCTIKLNKEDSFYDRFGREGHQRE